MIMIGTITADMIATIPIAEIAMMIAAAGRKNAATTITTGEAMTTGAGTNTIITAFAASWKASCAEVFFFGGLADVDRTIAGLDASARRVFHLAPT
jgi:hypothetical protein